MFSFKTENVDQLHSHNITIRKLEPSQLSTLNMSTQRQSAPIPSTSQRPVPMVQGPRRIIHLPQIRMLSKGRPAGIRVVNVKSIKPPDPEVVKKQEEEKLRAQLSKEIEWKSRLCAHREYECILPVLSGRLYCARHILQDSTAPFRQCSHVYSNGKRCPIPTPSIPQDRREAALCFAHARASLASRQRSSAPPPPVISTETLLTQLQHYVKPERTRTTSCASSVSVVSDPAEQDTGIPHAVDPFKQIDAVAINNAVSSNILDCGSESDSDPDVATLGRDGDVRATEDSLENLEMSPLRLAGVYTAEEVVSEARLTLQTLQTSYVKQMARLKVLLTAAKGEYLRSLKVEKEHCCSINSQARTGPLTVKERQQLKKLKAYASFHTHHGAAAAAHRKLQRRRAKVNDSHSNRPIPSQGRCTFTEGGVRCATPVVPSAKHCMKHILEDRQQVLFVPCGDARSGDACREALARLPRAPLCKYHTNPPPYTVFTLKKEGSGSESDGSTLDASEAEGSATGRLPDLAAEDIANFV